MSQNGTQAIHNPPPHTLRILLGAREPVLVRYEAKRCGEWVRFGRMNDGRHV